MKAIYKGGSISNRRFCTNPDRHLQKDQLMNSAPEIFENRGRKVDEDRIRAENDKEIARLKATIADVVTENPETKNPDDACRGGGRYEFHLL